MRHTNGRCYSAFITVTHSDGTYDVYFLEDGETASGLDSSHIKRPLVSTRLKTYPNWESYHGEVFFDAGTKKGEDPDDVDYELEAGEWMVQSITADNNFICCRLGRPHREEDNEIFDVSYVIRMIRKYEEE